MKQKYIKMIIEIILSTLNVFNWFKRAFKNKKPKLNEKAVAPIAKVSSGK